MATATLIVLAFLSCLKLYLTMVMKSSLFLHCLFTVVINKCFYSFRSCVVLLKDISDFIHIKTSDIKKDKEIRHMIIEDAKETLQTSSEYSFYYDRLQSIMESSCWLLPATAVRSPAPRGPCAR